MVADDVDCRDMNDACHDAHAREGARLAKRALGKPWARFRESVPQGLRRNAQFAFVTLTPSLVAFCMTLSHCAPSDQ